MKEALYYKKEEQKRVRCYLCRFNCRIADGSRGVCAVRENRGGTLFSLVYGKVCTESIDPIEKKPLFHVMPGSTTYSIATRGCNFHCSHCQNYTISQVTPQTPLHEAEQAPEEIVAKAKVSGCASISYTYTEPTIFYEFALDTARLAKEAGLRNIFVTNGYIGKEALTEIAPCLDAANIDLKAFSTEFYRNVVHAELNKVLDTIIDYKKLGIWLELTTLIIPGLNDSEQELKEIASFILKNLGVDTPWHVTQFYPTYKLLTPPRTSQTTLKEAREIGMAAGLRYVYEGNVPGQGGENTFCPFCNGLLIARYGFAVESNRIKNGACPECGAPIGGVGL